MIYNNMGHQTLELTIHLSQSNDCYQCVAMLCHATSICGFQSAPF